MRKLLPRVTLLVTLLLLACAPAAGQAEGGTPPPNPLPFGEAEAARLLKSQGNRERAWGAYLAGAHGLKGQAPLVAGLLEDPNVVSGGWEEGVVRQAALDALIRLDAEVPADRLLPLYASSPDEVIILLAAAPSKNARELLGLFDEEAEDERWAAVGNLLAEARAPGFAARLLAGLKIAAWVYVYDSEGERGYNGGGGGGCGGGGGYTQLPEGFPPVGHYALTLSGRRGAVVVAPGRRKVYYVRTLARGGGAGCVPLTRDESRVGYLAGMLGTTEKELGLEVRPLREVVCKDARQCGRALAAVRDEVVGAYAGALGRLLDAELLDPAEAAGLKPDITFYLNDSRDRRTFPLPGKLKGVRVEVHGAEAEPPDGPAEPAGDAPR